MVPILCTVVLHYERILYQDTEEKDVAQDVQDMHDVTHDERAVPVVFHCICYTNIVSVLSLCYLCAISVLSLCYLCAISVLSLCYLCAISLRQMWLQDVSQAVSAEPATEAEVAGVGAGVGSEPVAGVGAVAEEGIAGVVAEAEAVAGAGVGVGAEPVAGAEVGAVADEELYVPPPQESLTALDGMNNGCLILGNHGARKSYGEDKMSSLEYLGLDEKKKLAAHYDIRGVRQYEDSPCKCSVEPGCWDLYALTKQHPRDCDCYEFHTVRTKPVIKCKCFFTFNMADWVSATEDWAEDTRTEHAGEIYAINQATVVSKAEEIFDVLAKKKCGDLS